nr:MAG TPA: hypothetical protein [Caudoviricetes sp.]
MFLPQADALSDRKRWDYEHSSKQHSYHPYFYRWNDVYRGINGQRKCQRNHIFQGETADFEQCRHSAQSIRKFTNTCKIQLDFCLIVR